VRLFRDEGINGREETVLGNPVLVLPATLKVEKKEGVVGGHCIGMPGVFSGLL
jgi:hypothetical protein